MNLKFIICKVLQKEAYLCASRSANTVDVVLMPQGLHNEPDKLRREVQKAIDTEPAGVTYDATLLGYGLCSNGIAGLSAKIPLVVPRAHDCSTLLLGSKEKYREYFDTHRGVYWYSPGWINTGTQPGKDRYERTLEEYREKYGEDNAQYLMDMEQSWMKEYSWATYIDWGFPHCEEEKQYTRACAEYLGWNFDVLKADQGLMQRLVDGQWAENEFLVVKPGQKIEEDLTNEGIIKGQ